jgi:DnaJ-class molecular chaperone
VTQSDYYGILGVHKNASQHQIRDAYRGSALQYHPDQNRGNPVVAETMKQINEAYAVLSDPRKRSEYDGLRKQYGQFACDRFRRGYSEQDIFRGSDINQIFEEMTRAFGLSGFDEVFKDFYGPEYRTFKFRRSGFFGMGFMFFGPSRGKCHHGLRYEGEQEKFRQPEIPSFGSGLPKVTKFFLNKLLGMELPERGKDWYDEITIDPEQAEKGGEIKYSNRRKSKDLLVRVPPEIKDGQRIRLRGMGASGQGEAGAGDLYLRVRVKRSLLRKIRDFLGYGETSVR